MLSLVAARTAHADAAKDFKAGTVVKLDVASTVAGAPRTSTAPRPIAKARESFDFTIAASDLGLNYPVSITLRGRSLGGGWIEYAVDNRYSPPISVGGGHTLSRIAGSLRMRVAHVRGDWPHNYGNARLTTVGTNYVTAYGDWGELRVALTELVLRGGVKQPALARISPSTTRVCSDPIRKTRYPLTVTLLDTAKGTGASVDLKSPRGSGVGLAPGIVIRPGNRTANITGTVEPGFVGTAHITAASGGVEQSIDISVYPSSNCR